MILLNFSHPLTPDHLAQLEALAGDKIARVINAPAQFDHARPFSGRSLTVPAHTSAVARSGDRPQPLVLVAFRSQSGMLSEVKSRGGQYGSLPFDGIGAFTRRYNRSSLLSCIPVSTLE